MNYMQLTYQKSAAASIAAAQANEKSFELDLGYDLFTARSMKREEKAKKRQDYMFKMNCVVAKQTG